MNSFPKFVKQKERPMLLKSTAAAAAAGAGTSTVSLPNEAIRCMMLKPSGNLFPGLPAVRRDNFCKGGHTHSSLKPNQSPTLLLGPNRRRQSNLTSDNGKTPRKTPTPFSRPLVPVVLALMAGLASPAWGLRLPEKWLAAALVLFWAILGVLWLARRPVRLLPLPLFWLLGVAFYQQALHPVFPLHHLVN